MPLRTGALRLRLRQAAPHVILFLALVAAGAASLALRSPYDNGKLLIWLPAGIAMAAVLRGGTRFAPAVWLAGFLVTASVRPLSMAVLAATGDLLSALSAHWLLVLAGFDPSMRRKRDAALFAGLGALLATMPTASIGVLAQGLTGVLPWEGAGLRWVAWWVGNAAGVLAIGPVVLLAQRSWTTDLARGGRLVEAGAIYLAIAVLASAGLWFPWLGTTELVHVLLPLPLVLWAGLRFGAPGTPVAVCIAVAGTLAVTTAGPHGHAELDPRWQLWANVLVLSTTGLIVMALETERAAAEQALRRREAQYRAIVEGGVEMICRFRPDGVLTFANDAYCRYFGRTRDALVGRRLQDLLPPGESADVEARFAAYHVDMEPHTHEHRVVRGDGQVTWVRWTNSIVRDGSDAVNELQSVGRDVSRERSLAAEREALAMRNAAIVRALGEIVYDHDLANDVVEWGGEFERVLGYPPDEMGADGTTWLRRVYPDDRPRVTTEFHRALAEHRIFDCQYRFQRRDGSWAWMQDRGVPVLNDDRVPVRFVGVFRDVTDAVSSAAALRESEERFRLAATFGSDVIYEWDIATGAVQHFGARSDGPDDAFEPQDGSALGWAHQIVAEDRERIAAAVRRHLERGEPFAEQYRVQHADGEVRIWTDRGAAVRDAHGGAVKWIGVRTDVTRQRQLEDQLRQAQKMESVGQLAGGVAHDFNNLLQVIQGYTALASDPEIDPEERAIDLVQVQKAADRAAQLTRQLLAFGRRQPLLMRDTDLAETISHLLQMVRRLIGEHIEVRLVTSGSVDNIRCDRAQIEQVVLNLCVNARDAMPDGGQLTLTVDHRAVSAAEARRRPGLRAGAYVRLRVADTGTGMSAETKRRVFEPFFTTKPEGQGSGLGLAVAYGVVKQHDGFIDVESAVGTGTTVTILLPVVARAETSPVAVGGIAAVPGRGERILLAEDEPPVRDLARTILARAGYDVVVARDGQEALELFRAPGPPVDLAILDAVMPRLGGLEVRSRMLAERPGMRVLLCSGYPGGAVIGSGQLADSPFIAKPYRASELLDRVRQALAQSAAS